MARKKITVAYLNKESQRKASFKKRCKGFMKKVEELSTLCGVEACAVTYSEFQSQPAIWPSPAEARRVLERFMERPEMDKARFMQNQMSFTRQLIERARNKLRRLQRENKRKELAIFMFRCIQGTANIGDFDVRDTGEMNVVINEVLTEITERMEELRASGEGPSSSAVATEEEMKAAAAQPGSMEEKDQNPPVFSYWNLLMNPIDDVSDSLFDTPFAPPGSD